MLNFITFPGHPELRLYRACRSIEGKRNPRHIFRQAQYDYALFFFLFIALFAGCKNDQKKKPTRQLTIEDIKNPSMNTGQMMVKKETDDIDSYIKRHGYEMQKTGTGLRYMIYKKGTGEKAEKGKVAKISYKISLLDGTECYSSEKEGPTEFLIGQDQIESGLHEGVQYLHVGDKAIIILPSYLAHGLLGDRKKIPPRSSVVYDIELLSLK